MNEPQFVFGVDLDGVCGNYTAGFRAAVAQILGVDPATLGEPQSWNYGQWPIRDQAHFNELHDEAVAKYNLFQDMPPMPDCAENLWRLSDAGIYIRIITHRLLRKNNHQKVIADTVAWLDKNNIPYRGIAFEGNKADIGADLYIDDAPHNITLRKAHKDCIIYDAGYNQSMPGLRVTNWKDAADLVLARYVDRSLG